MIRLLVALCAGTLIAADGVAPVPATIPRHIAAWTIPLRTLELSPEVTGRIASITVEAGSRIPDGPAPVVVLDPELADLAVRQAAAAVEQARALAEQQRQAVIAAEATVQARTADGQRRNAERLQAERDLTRAETLSAEHRLSDQERDRATLAVAQAARAEQSAAADLAAAIAAKAQAAAAAVAVAAQVSEAEIRLATAQAQRARHELRAPAGWVVVERMLEPGAMVSAGSPVLRLADVNALLLQLRLDEAEIAVLRANAAAGTLMVRFANAAPVAATVRRIDVRYDVASRKRLVELVIPGTAAPEPSGGLACEVDLAVPDPVGGLAVPAALVQWRIEQPWVHLADGGETPVLVLRRAEDTVVIAPGSLPPGATLLPFPASAPAR